MQPARRISPWEALPAAATSAPAWFSATYFLISINVMIFLIMVLRGVPIFSPGGRQLLDWGADYGPATLGAGQYWRVVTAAFLHFGLLHLAINMWSLYIVVPPIERLFGKTMTFAIYLLTGAGASMLSLFWHPNSVGAGASGALFGFIGAIIAFFHFAHLETHPELVRSVRSWAVRMAVINLVFGMTMPGIDNMAHFGGLVTGLLIGTFFAFTFHGPVEGRFARQMLIAAACAVALAGVFGVLVRLG
jgi:rhomboid protease GluP